MRLSCKTSLMVIQNVPNVLPFISIDDGGSCIQLRMYSLRVLSENVRVCVRRSSRDAQEAHGGRWCHKTIIQIGAWHHQITACSNGFHSVKLWVRKYAQDTT